MPLATAIMGGVGLLNGATSAIGQKYAADKYLEGVQQTNEQNYKIWQEQKEHNLDMFNVQNDANVRNWQNQFDQTNAYNTAVAQRQRLEEAGLNPSIMMQGGNAGVASSSGIPTATAQPANSPQMQSPEFIESPLTIFTSQAINSLVQIANAVNTNAETKTINEIRQPLVKKTNAEYETEVAKKHYITAQTLHEKEKHHLTYEQSEGQRLENEFNRTTMETRVLLQDEILRHTIAQRIGQSLSNEAQTIINEWLPAQQQANVALATYQAVKAYHEGKLTEEQVRTEVKRQILIGAQTQTEYAKQATEKSMQNYYNTGSILNIANVGKVNAETAKVNAEKADIEESTRGKRIEHDKLEKTADAFIEATNSAFQLENTLNKGGKKYYENQHNVDDHFRYKDGKYSKGKAKHSLKTGVYNLEYETEDGY